MKKLIEENPFYKLFDILSENAVKDLHGSINRCLREDDKNPLPEKVYGVREYPDWKQQKDALELAMTKRSIAFEPIDSL